MNDQDRHAHSDHAGPPGAVVMSLSTVMVATNARLLGGIGKGLGGEAVQGSEWGR